jgi:undecaprenyl diphosphate synthase
VAARYVAIIMDGNARWATERGVPVLDGHRRGAQTLKQTVRDAVSLDLLELTVYAFSTENWSRPRWEVEGLMAMFAELIESETPELDEEGVRMRFIGRRGGVSEELLDRMAWAEEKTAGNSRMTLFVAFNYGGRAEIVDAARRFPAEGEEEDFAKLLYAPEMNDPDILIRTSGERRLSNYLLWQSAYSELVFTDTLWPDFTKADLADALEEFEVRERRFGAR